MVSSGITVKSDQLSVNRQMKIDNSPETTTKPPNRVSRRSREALKGNHWDKMWGWGSAVAEAKIKGAVSSIIGKRLPLFMLDVTFFASKEDIEQLTKVLESVANTIDFKKYSKRTSIDDWI